jgi:hypothetical protein
VEGCVLAAIEMLETQRGGEVMGECFEFEIGLKLTQNLK